MSELVKKYRSLLQVVGFLPRHDLATICRTASSDMIHAISEMCYNVLYEDVHLTTAQKAKLRGLKRHMRVLSDPKSGLRTKAKILKSDGVPILEAIAQPVLAALQ